MSAFVVSIDPGQIVGGILVLVIAQAAVAFVAVKVLEAKTAERHEQNQARFLNLESALGLIKPDEVAFLRASEARTLIEEQDKIHERQNADIFHVRERLGIVASTVEHHGKRLDTLEERTRS